MKGIIAATAILALAACAPMAHQHATAEKSAAQAPPPVEQLHHHHGWIGGLVHRLHEWAHSP